MEGIIEKLKKVGTLTGSVRFGVKNPQDEDYLILVSEWRKVLPDEATMIGFTYDKNYNKFDEFQSFKYKTKETTYNFLVFWEKKEYRIWKRATTEICKLSKSLLEDKSARVAIFTSLKDAIRGKNEEQ